jgi:hypothetical protein
MTNLSRRLKGLVLDGRAGPWHLCVLVALLQWMERHPGRDCLFVRRKELMRLAKIRSEKTFYKTLKELGEWGYVEYEVRKDKRGSRVTLPM